MKISIITPCLNSEKTIERTINSIIIQDYEDIEYIIVDGKSTDNTLNIIKKYADKYRFIKYISEKDNSMTEALNKGLKIAVGDIIGVINADDEYFPNIFKFINEQFNNSDIDVLVGNSYHIDEKTKKIKYISTPKYASNYILMNILDCFFPECSVFYSKKAIKNIGYYNEDIKYTQDYDLYLRFIKYGYTIKYFNKNIGKFYISDEQYSTSIHSKMMDETLKYIDYKCIHIFLKKTKINSFIRVLLGLRKYQNFGDFIMHAIGS